MRHLLLVLGMNILALCPTLASPARTTSSTIMRVSPKPSAKAVQSIPANTDVDLDNCSKDWCRVSWHNQLGYVSANAVTASTPDNSLAPMPVDRPPPSSSGPSFGLPFSIQLGGSGSGPGFQEPGVHCSGVVSNPGC
ncbi:MAG TPA: SH3 domain-containing protein [Beijerinckiaceae bacterium]|nr:SH3 domain-containing protein [Beijerinckiaceae bacterium]